MDIVQEEVIRDLQDFLNDARRNDRRLADLWRVELITSYSTKELLCVDVRCIFDLSVLKFYIEENWIVEEGNHTYRADKIVSLSDPKYREKVLSYIKRYN